MPVISTWSNSPAPGANYNDFTNWNGSVPGFADTAEFGATSGPNISLVDFLFVGQWLFSPGAGQYNFDIAGIADLTFTDRGITMVSGSVHIIDFGELSFDNNSTAGAALIDDFGSVDFSASARAGTATIHAFAGGGALTGIPGTSNVGFHNNATGDSAQFIADAGSIVDFSQTAGPANDKHVTAGSIAGAGTYYLGSDQLTVGLNGLSTEVSGPVDDAGYYVAYTGGSLVKVGHGTLRLSHVGNTYSGGTILEFGKLDVAATGAAGTGAITFAGRATLEIENAALPGHHFGNKVDAFARHDIIDLAGLRFHAGATATYHKANHHLTVHSGTVTDTLTLLSPHGHLFGTANDGHGGTDVLLFA